MDKENLIVMKFSESGEHYVDDASMALLEQLSKLADLARAGDIDSIAAIATYKQSKHPGKSVATCYTIGKEGTGLQDLVYGLERLKFRMMTT